MRDYGLLPYPMIYEKWNADTDLKLFQRYVIQGAYHGTSFEMFKTETKTQYRNRMKDVNKINLFS